MSSVNKDICFNSIVHTLISFSLLITIILLGILSMMLKRSDGARSILALYLSLQKSFKFLTITYDATCRGFGEGNGTPLQYSCLENPMDAGAWWAAVYGVAQSRTCLKRLSSSTSRRLIGWTLSYSLLRLAESESLPCADQLSPSLCISLIGWTLAYVLPGLADSYLVFFSDWLTPIR